MVKCGWLLDKAYAACQWLKADAKHGRISAKRHAGGGDGGAGIDVNAVFLDAQIRPTLPVGQPRKVGHIQNDIADAKFSIRVPHEIVTNRSALIRQHVIKRQSVGTRRNNHIMRDGIAFRPIIMRHRQGQGWIFRFPDGAKIGNGAQACEIHAPIVARPAIIRVDGVPVGFENIIENKIVPAAAQLYGHQAGINKDVAFNEKAAESVVQIDTPAPFGEE